MPSRQPAVPPPGAPPPGAPSPGAPSPGMQLAGVPAEGKPARHPAQRDEGLLPPVATAAVPGTPFGLAIVGLPPATSGPASASLPIGIGSILVSFMVLCFGTVGAQGGWGPAISGAFALLAAFAGVAAVTLGQVGRRQLQRGRGRVTGRGVAIAGIVCGSIGLAFTGLFFLLALALVA
jgi:hypothetical protein